MWRSQRQIHAVHKEIDTVNERFFTIIALVVESSFLLVFHLFWWSISKPFWLHK